MTAIQIWIQVIPLSERAHVVRTGGYENYTKEILERASFNELNDEEKKSHRWRYVTLAPSPKLPRHRLDAPHCQTLGWQALPVNGGAQDPNSTSPSISRRSTVIPHPLTSVHSSIMAAEHMSHDEVSISPCSRSINSPRQPTIVRSLTYDRSSSPSWVNSLTIAKARTMVPST